MISINKKTNKGRGYFQRNIWFDLYDWLINCILEPIKNEAGIKDQVISFFKAKDYSQPKRIKTVQEDGKRPVH